MRLRSIAIGCVLLVVLTGVVPSATGSGMAYDPQVIVRYKGTFSSFEYTASKIDQSGGTTFLSPKTESWTWLYTWVGKLSVLHQRRPFTFTTQSMSGTVKRVDQLPDQRTGNCLFTYGAKRGAYPLNAPVQVPFSASEGYVWGNGSVTFIQFPPPATNNVVVRSRADPKRNGHCRDIGPSSAMAATFPPSMGNVFKFVDLSRPLVRTRRFDRSFHPPGNPPQVRETLRSSITLDIGASR